MSQGLGSKPSIRRYLKSIALGESYELAIGGVDYWACIFESI